MVHRQDFRLGLAIDPKTKLCLPIVMDLKIGISVSDLTQIQRQNKFLVSENIFLFKNGIRFLRQKFSSQLSPTKVFSHPKN